ncbi:hypothetical protein AM974 [Anaplasma marginale str. St. Maries]|nr:hypothetical protein AM974 [Anaplasma marginale str. St. Maries]
MRSIPPAIMHKIYNKAGGLRPSSTVNLTRLNHVHGCYVATTLNHTLMMRNAARMRHVAYLQSSIAAHW